MVDINPQFLLNDPKSKSEIPISLVFYFGGGKRFFYATGRKIHPKHWDGGDQRVKRVKGDEKTNRKHNRINKEIANITEAIHDIFDKYDRAREVPTKQMIKAELDRRFKIKKQKTPINFLEFAQKIINDSRNGVRLNKGNRITESTIKGYETTRYHLEEFYRRKRYSKSFEDINMDFYQSFIRYFHEDNKAKNTIAKNIKNVRVFIKEAYQQGLTDNRIFENPEFAVEEEDTDHIALNKEDMRKIEEADLTILPTLDKVRDILIMSCYIGTRFADLRRLTKDHIIDGGNKIKIRTQKTGKPVIIPIHKKVKSIFKKYDSSPPPMMTNQKLNEYYKELGKKAKLNEIEIINITLGGIKQELRKKRHELITTHTGRRTFATNAIRGGIPERDVMMITGHTTTTAFRKYVGITQDEKAGYSGAY